MDILTNDELKTLSIISEHFNLVYNNESEYVDIKCNDYDLCDCYNHCPVQQYCNKFDKINPKLVKQYIEEHK